MNLNHRTEYLTERIKVLYIPVNKTEGVPFLYINFLHLSSFFSVLLFFKYMQILVNVFTVNGILRKVCDRHVKVNFI